jgi:ubiquinone/menaquinone biosynthesis C-methylase UbiE
MTKEKTKVEKEKEFHDEYFSGNSDTRRKQEKFYDKSIQQIEHQYVFDQFGDMNGKRVLIYGVGDHSSLIKDFVNRGAYVVGIDISSEAVKKINKRIASDKSEHLCTAMEMDCEDLTFEPESFDFVFGRSIIHHLDIPKSLQTINRVLKKGGKVAFVEPMATNPIIQLYRHLTPADRTPDEHPLTSSDLRLFSSMFNNVNLKYLYLLTSLAFIIRILGLNDKYFMPTFRFLHKIDNILSHIPGVKFLYWDIIILGMKK